jgi:hypothetical protein
MIVKEIERSRQCVKSAVLSGFDYFESKDTIVGMILGGPGMVKSIVVTMPDEVFFCFIPEGIGMLRTAYLKMVPYMSNNEIRFVDQDKTETLRMFLI